MNIACRDQDVIVGSRNRNIPFALLDMKIGENPETHESYVMRGLVDVYHGPDILAAVGKLRSCKSLRAMALRQHFILADLRLTDAPRR